MSNRRIEDLFRMCMLITELNLLTNALDSEIKYSNELIRISKMIEAENRWDYPIDKMTLAGLQSFKMVLDELMKLIARNADWLAIQGAPTQTQP
ncbi:agamous-like MADS-box protein AGL62-like [Trifolium medium]|uniref:Agamous-like MADS-box protein AGL62-like n=1 Tax=Trifolium medium TaxID=97028 RepID=A0A392R0D2_9FABA|nr:agamous-like MADS-box protein AGL62-like [Trifolium medium]